MGVFCVSSSVCKSLPYVLVNFVSSTLEIVDSVNAHNILLILFISLSIFFSFILRIFNYKYYFNNYECDVLLFVLIISFVLFKLVN